MTHAFVFVDGTPERTPVMLLHGSGGDEHELIALAGRVAPGSPAVGIRGSAPFEGGYAFFHRNPNRTIDEADLRGRIGPLATFIETIGAEHNFATRPVAIGFSNGAIMAAALLMTHPELLTGAILFRPLSPFANAETTDLNGKPVLIIDGEKDSRRSPGDGARLAERLTRTGAAITHHVLPCGHTITDVDVDLAHAWLAPLLSRPSR